ncbi:MAG: hypothetical protein LQ340_005377 [Diploschistes diacapsis]|nr:MAG: hypothetical protein LQ340_005377 [Diploschistes diacapsis]
MQLSMQRAHEFVKLRAERSLKAPKLLLHRTKDLMANAFHRSTGSRPFSFNKLDDKPPKLRSTLEPMKPKAAEADNEEVGKQTHACNQHQADHDSKRNDKLQIQNVDEALLRSKREKTDAPADIGDQVYSNICDRRDDTKDDNSSLEKHHDHDAVLSSGSEVSEVFEDTQVNSVAQKATSLGGNFVLLQQQAASAKEKRELTDKIASLKRVSLASLCAHLAQTNAADGRISSLEAKLLKSQNENGALRRDLEISRKDQTRTEQELGSLQSEYAFLSSKYETVQRLYQQAHHGSTEVNEEIVEVRKLTYQEMKKRLHILENRRDAELKEIEKEVHKLRRVRAYQDTFIDHLTEEKDRAKKDNRSLLVKTTDCFNKMKTAITPSAELQLLEELHNIVHAQLQNYRNASSRYSQRYSNLTRQREKALFQEGLAVARAQKAQNQLEKQAELLRAREEQLNEVEMQAEILREESNVKERQQDAKISKLEEEVHRLQYSYLDERTEAVLRETQYSIDNLQAEKQALEEKVMSLSAKLRLREMFEVKKWVETIAEDEDHQKNPDQKTVKNGGMSGQTSETRSSDRTMVEEENAPVPKIVSIGAVYAWIRESEMKQAELEEADSGVETEWEDESF